MEYPFSSLCREPRCLARFILHEGGNIELLEARLWPDLLTNLSLLLIYLLKRTF